MCIRDSILGYIRDQRVAQLLGTTLSSDAFYLAFRIPNLLRRLVAEGAMSAAFVPVFTTYLVEKSEKEVWQFANRLFWTLAVSVTAIVALGMIFSPASVSYTHLIERLRSAGRKAEAYDNADTIANYLGEQARPGDVVLVMSNGSFDGLCGKLLQRLEAARSSTVRGR